MSKSFNIDNFRKGKLDGKLMTGAVLLFFVLLLLGVVNASAVECPPGFKWVRMSGVGCVQENCLEIEHAKLSYTSACICIEGYKSCYEPVDYTNFDKSKCGPNCPFSRLIACVKPGEPCPGKPEKEEEWMEEAPIEKPPEDELPLLEVVVTLGAIGGIIFTIRRTIKIRRRNEWQEKAKEEEPPETCQPCTRYCRKIELELEPALRKITHLSFSASAPVSSEQSKEWQVKGELVDGLNKAVMAHRRREKPEKLQEQVAPLAHTLLQQIMEWLRGESAPRDVFVTGHLEGGKVTCQFILSHCKRRGTVNVWEEDAKWKATIKDERDEFVGTLRGMEPTELGIPEQVALDLTRLLMQFIEKI